jgi:hypothetical protein
VIAGLSGECIEEQGHYWVGLDIAPAMLQVGLVSILLGLSSSLSIRLLLPHSPQKIINNV